MVLIIDIPGKVKTPVMPSLDALTGLEQMYHVYKKDLFSVIGLYGESQAFFHTKEFFAP